VPPLVLFGLAAILDGVSGLFAGAGISYAKLAVGLCTLWMVVAGIRDGKSIHTDSILVQGAAHVVVFLYTTALIASFFV